MYWCIVKSGHRPNGTVKLKSPTDTASRNTVINHGRLGEWKRPSFLCPSLDHRRGIPSRNSQRSSHFSTVTGCIHKSFFHDTFSCTLRYHGETFFSDAVRRTKTGLLPLTIPAHCSTFLSRQVKFGILDLSRQLTWRNNVPACMIRDSDNYVHASCCKWCC